MNAVGAPPSAPPNRQGIKTHERSPQAGLTHGRFPDRDDEMRLLPVLNLDPGDDHGIGRVKPAAPLLDLAGPRHAVAVEGLGQTDPGRLRGGEVRPCNTTWTPRNRRTSPADGPCVTRSKVEPANPSRVPFANRRSIIRLRSRVPRK